MKANQIYVDMDRESVILPVHGMHIPFHISTIKNVVQPEADQAGYLRINFFTPGKRKETKKRKTGDYSLRTHTSL